MMPDNAQIQAFQKHVNVSRETIERLKIYEALLVKWNPAINLVGRNTLSDVWSRHFLDSAQLWDLTPKTATTWLDLGSGAGFPGLVIAILAAERNPGLVIELVDSDKRKATFLQIIGQETGINLKISTERAEDLPARNADVISARALAPLAGLLEFADIHGAENVICLFPKGRKHDLELTAARKYWTFDAQISPSVTDSDGVILKIGGLGRV